MVPHNPLFMANPDPQCKPDRPGALVISLDFELMWGMRDKPSLDHYLGNFTGVRQALPGMLHLFEKHGVKATFATVGLLFFNNKLEMMEALPALRPTYLNSRLSPYTDHLGKVGADERADPYHFAASLIRDIQRHPAHEVACHTFSHYYCLEPGQTVEQFAADLQAAIAAAKAMGISLRSLVFPRNQFNAAYLAVCHQQGILAYRGNERNWLHEARNSEQESLLRRGPRLLDAWINLTGPNCHPFPRTYDRQPMNIPASRFLRPCNKKLRMFESLRLRRITKAMDHAALTGTIFHLWWHPHNFGVNIDENLAFLDKVLAHYTQLRAACGMESLTMAEAATCTH